jgi:hypothetical protein
MVGTETPETGWMVCEVGQFDRAPMIAAHIGHYDPARALRAVAAKRATVEDLRTAARELHEAQTREVTTRGTQFWAEDAARVERKQVKVTTLHRVATGIATEWSGHPGHRPAWPA